MKIKRFEFREVLDSRSEMTLETVLETEQGIFLSMVPVGGSTGKREAVPLNLSEIQGQPLKTLEIQLLDRKFESIAEFDDFLIRLDGSSDKHVLGGNTLLGLSLAFARGLAAVHGRPLWAEIREEFFPNVRENYPKIFANFIEGGVHAINNLDLQEYLVISPGENLRQEIRLLADLYRALGEELRQGRLERVPVGDEGGFDLNFISNLQPLQILQGLLNKFHLSNFALGLDSAADFFFRDGSYVFEKKRIGPENLLGVYEKYSQALPRLISLEDPFSEDDRASFQKIRNSLPNLWIVGDDLTVSNAVRIEASLKNGEINALILKPNQIGTVTEACRAIQVAHNLGAKVIVSHRSRETEDNFLVHFAKAAGVFGVKIGAPARERILKYNELLRLY